jgi:hypothetical protein
MTPEQRSLVRKVVAGLRGYGNVERAVREVVEGKLPPASLADLLRERLPAAWKDQPHHELRPELWTKRLMPVTEQHGMDSMEWRMHRHAELMDALLDDAGVIWIEAMKPQMDVIAQALADTAAGREGAAARLEDAMLVGGPGPREVAARLRETPRFDALIDKWKGQPPPAPEPQAARKGPTLNDVVSGLQKAFQIFQAIQNLPKAAPRPQRGERPIAKFDRVKRLVVSGDDLVVVREDGAVKVDLATAATTPTAVPPEIPTITAAELDHMNDPRFVIAATLRLPDEQIVVVGTEEGGEGGVIALGDLLSGEWLKNEGTEEGQFTCLASDGDVYAVGTAQGDVILFDADLGLIDGADVPGAVVHVAILSDGRVAALTRTGGLYVVEIDRS